MYQNIQLFIISKCIILSVTIFQYSLHKFKNVCYAKTPSHSRQYPGLAPEYRVRVSVSILLGLATGAIPGYGQFKHSVQLLHIAHDTIPSKFTINSWLRISGDQQEFNMSTVYPCLLYTSDAADE